MITRVWPKVTGRSGDVLTFRLGGQETAVGPVTLGPRVTYTIGQETPVDTFVQGRFLSVNVESLGGAAWRMGSFDLEFREAGAF